MRRVPREYTQLGILAPELIEELKRYVYSCDYRVKLSLGNRDIYLYLEGERIGTVFCRST